MVSEAWSRGYACPTHAHAVRRLSPAPHAACSKTLPQRMRRRWLLGLLVLQSTSSIVLDAYQDLLKHHLVVTLFLTMLVGAGGNAGNQSAIKVIRGLVRRQPAPSARRWHRLFIK